MIYEPVINNKGVTECIMRIADDGLRSAIPIDEGNSDYQAYLRWLENPDAEEGGTL